MRIEPIENQNYKIQSFYSKNNFIKPIFKAKVPDDLVTSAAEHIGDSSHGGLIAGIIAFLGVGWAMLRKHKSSVDKKLAQAEKEAAEKLKKESEARLRNLKAENDALSRQLDEINKKLFGDSSSKGSVNVNSSTKTGTQRRSSNNLVGNNNFSSSSGTSNTRKNDTVNNSGKRTECNSTNSTSQQTQNTNNDSISATIQELENWNKGYNERLNELEQKIIDTKETREVLSTSARLAQIDATRNFDRIKGYDAQKQILIQKFVSPVQNNSNNIPNAILMYGPKGTGKTSFITAVLDETECNKISLISTLNEKEDLLAFRTALNQAKKYYDEHGKRTIIQIDEAEGYFNGNENTVREFSDLINNASNNYYATVLATTNHPQEINSLILQTDKMESLFIPPAGKSDIAEILKFVLRDFAEENVNYNELAALIIEKAGKDAYSNARIYNMARNLAARSSNAALNAKIKQQKNMNTKLLTQYDIKQEIIQKEFAPDIKSETIETISKFSIKKDSIEEMIEWQKNFNARMDTLEQTARESREIIELNATKNLLSKLNNIKTFERIQGYSKQKEIIFKKFLQPLKNRQQLPNIVLMYGPKGTGKTLFTKATVEESGCNHIVFSSTLDELEDLMLFKDIVDGAKKNYEKNGKNTIIQIDEIDGILSSTPEVVKEYRQIIDNLSDNYHATIFATTNHLQNLNKDILNASKLEKIRILPAQKDDIAQILKFVLSDFSEKNINYDKLAGLILKKAGSDAYSNAYIYNEAYNYVTSRVDNAVSQKIKQNTRAYFDKITEEEIINLIKDKNFVPDIPKAILDKYKNL